MTTHLSSRGKQRDERNEKGTSDEGEEVEEERQLEIKKSVEIEKRKTEK